MASGKWLEVDRDIASAIEHFTRAAELFAAGGLEEGELAGYRARMAFMHAMQSGHTSLEAALVRCLKLFGEDVGKGGDWHTDLIDRAAVQVDDRPPVLGEASVAAAHETRRFRHVATRSYDNFAAPRAKPALDAAGLLARTLSAEIAAFKSAVDDPEPGDEEASPKP